MKVLAFIIALALLVTPLAAAAPPLTTVHRIGFLWNSSPSFTHYLLAAFRHGLQERGYVEGHALHHREPLCGGEPRAPPRPRRRVGQPPGGGHRHVWFPGRPGGQAGDQYYSGRERG